MDEAEGVRNAISDFVASLSDDQKNALADIIVGVDFDGDQLMDYLTLEVFAEE